MRAQTALLLIAGFVLFLFFVLGGRGSPREEDVPLDAPVALGWEGDGGGDHQRNSPLREEAKLVGVLLGRVLLR